MRSPGKTRRGTLLLLISLLSAGLGSGGCATAGLAAAGPLLGSLWAFADRSVERTLPADLSTTWGATVDALARMAVRVEQTDKSGDKWLLTGTGEAVTVYGTLERITAGMTKVSVRVEAGRLLADKRTGEELLNQASASLASLAGTDRRDATPAADAAQLGALQREIERLGAKIEQGRDTKRSPAEPEVSRAPTVSTSPIIVIPTSVGVATVPALDASAARQTVPTTSSRQRGPGESGPPTRLEALETHNTPANDIFAAPLKPAEVLRPVEGLRIKPTGQ